MRSAQRIAQNPVQRRKLRRGAIVAAIAAFGVGGLDYVITGGPTWNPIGADAPRFELVASAAAAEHPAAAAARAHGAELVRDLPERMAAEAALDTYDPNISANDLLGAPNYTQALYADLELASLLDTLKPQPAARIELLVQPLATQWWR